MIKIIQFFLFIIIFKIESHAQTLPRVDSSHHLKPCHCIELGPKGLADLVADNTTSISYHLPDSLKQGQLIIFDAYGNTVKHWEIWASDEGPGKVTIRQGELEPGIYFYNIRTDRYLSVTKRMFVQ